MEVGPGQDRKNCGVVVNFTYTSKVLCVIFERREKQRGNKGPLSRGSERDLPERGMCERKENENVYEKVE